MGHWLDALYLKLPRRQTLFDQGWGDVEGAVAQARPLRERAAPPPLEVAWQPAVTRGGLRVQDGLASSPCQGLPGPVATVPVRRVGPAQGPLRARAVVLPSWGDEGWMMRQSLLAPLARRGVELLLFEGAFFGARRLSPEQLRIPTVAGFFQMGLSHVLEARGLLALLRAESDAPAGLVGYSMGGHMASQAALTLPWPVPMAALAPSHSAAPVFVEGPLRGLVRWSALGDGAAAKLALAFDRVNAHALPPPHPGARAVIVATRDDGIVPVHSMEALAARWGVAPRWVDTGHVAAWAFRRAALRQAVEDALLGPSA